MMTDPIADMLTRIRNAALARHDRTEMPHSKLKEHVARVLKGEGFIDDVRVSEGEGRKQLTLVLRYGRDRQSRHRRRPPRLDARAAASTCATTASTACAQGMGISILSTSRGVMTDREARRQRVGGELLCEVW